MTTLTSTLHTTRDMAEIVTREPKYYLKPCFIQSPGNAWSCDSSLAAVRTTSSFEFPSLVRKGNLYQIQYLQHNNPSAEDTGHRKWWGAQNTHGERKSTPSSAEEGYWCSMTMGGGASLDLIFFLNPAPYRTNNPHFRMRQKSQGTSLQNILTQKRFNDELFFKAWVYTASL